MKLKKMHWFGIVASLVLLTIDLVFFRGDEQMLLFLMGIAVGVVILPFIIGLSLENRKEQKISEMFLEFSRSLAESAATGTPISKSIVNMRKKNFGFLNPHVRKLANQIQLGIPVAKALSTFANDLGSPTVRRAISLMKEAEKSGGDIDFILDSTAKSISEIEKLKKERKSTIYNLVVQGYIIFFIFIGIVLVMEFKILPLTEGIADFSSLTGGLQNLQSADITNSGNFDPEDFTKPFLYLLLAQGLFVGLVIGKLTEGSLKSGLKHSFILMSSAFLISIGTRLFLGSPTGT